MTDWKYLRDGDLPPEGVVVETADSGGRHQELIFDHNLWWFPDRSMYVCYTPRSWRLTGATGLQGGSSPPRLEASCVRHGAPLVMCDHCSNIHLMAIWSGSLSGAELAAAIETLASDHFYFAPSEYMAVMTEAARRLKCSGRPEQPGKG